MNLAVLHRQPSGLSSPDPPRHIAAAAGQHTQVINPSRKPVRSRKLVPDCSDPEDSSAQYLLYEPLTQLLPAAQIPATAHQQLPEAYLAPESQSFSWDEHAQVSPVDMLRAQGGYLTGDTQAQELLAASAPPPSLWKLLKLGPGYQDDFIRGPEYRYQVDDTGRILDMVYIKRYRVPKPFQYAFTSSTSTQAPAKTTPQTLETSPAVAASADVFVVQHEADQAGGAVDDEDDEQEQQQYRDAEDGRYDFLGPVQHERHSTDSIQHQQDTLDTSPHAVSARSAGAGLRGPRRRAGQPSSLIELSDDSYLDEPRMLRGRASVSGGRSKVGRASSAAPQLTSADKARKPLHELLPPELVASLSVTPGSGGTTPSDSDESGQTQLVDLQPSAEQRPKQQAGLVLRVYPYCVGPRQLFNGLWELDLLDQVTFTDQLDEADLVLHQRPAPGERQFAYDRLLARAKQRGIPFVTIKDSSAVELRTSLLPVLDLYTGRLSPEQLSKQYGAKARGKLGRRIRL